MVVSVEESDRDSLLRPEKRFLIALSMDHDVSRRDLSRKSLYSDIYYRLKRYIERLYAGRRIIGSAAHIHCRQ